MYVQFFLNYAVYFFVYKVVQFILMFMPIYVYVSSSVVSIGWKWTFRFLIIWCFFFVYQVYVSFERSIKKDKHKDNKHILELFCFFLN